jgi:hypothetical protein
VRTFQFQRIRVSLGGVGEPVDDHLLPLVPDLLADCPVDLLEGVDLLVTLCDGYDKFAL